jgi:hypothetical protein
VSPGRLDILTSALSAVARLIMAARSDRDAEAIVHQLRALGPAQRADVDAIEQSARGRLADAETAALPKGERVRLAPDFPDACQECHAMPCVCPERESLIGGPLDGGD